LKKNRLDTNDALPPFNGILTNQYTNAELYVYLNDFRNKWAKKEDENILFNIQLIENELLRRSLG